MLTVFPSRSGEISVDAPRLDLTSGESQRRLIFRLKDNNRALEDLRAALDGDEGPTREAPRAASRHA